MLYRHPGICTKTPIEYPETVKEVKEEDLQPKIDNKKPSLIEQTTGVIINKPIPKITEVSDMIKLLPYEDQQRLTLDMNQRTKMEQKQRKST